MRQNDRLHAGQGIGEQAAFFLDRYLEAGDTLVRQVEDVLGVVQERGCVMVAAEQEDLPIQLENLRSCSGVRFPRPTSS